MYKKESKFSQKPLKLHEINIKFDDSEISLEEIRENIIHSLEKIDSELSEIKQSNKGRELNRSVINRKRHLVDNKLNLTESLKEINIKLKKHFKAHRGLSNYFMDVAKERLDKFKYNMLVDEAKKRELESKQYQPTDK